MAKKSEKKTIEPERDELAQSIADALNKLNKDGEKVAYFLDGYDESPTEFTDFISTGATMLDLIISNKKHGGIAAGRITEITGLEGSGKSLLAAHILANAQKMGASTVFIDTESAVNVDFFRAVGLDTSKTLWVQADTVEKIFDQITHLIEHIRKRPEYKDKLIAIVVDSVAAASTEREMESDFGKDGYATDKAIIISKGMRKLTNLIAKERIALVFTNQLRFKMNAPSFSDPYTTSGGKGISYHASTRLRLKQVGKIKNAEGKIVGVQVEAETQKNRLGPPHRKTEFEIYFDRGIDDYNSWLKALKEHKLIKQVGAWYAYDDNGTEIKFQSKDFPKFLDEDPVRKEKLYDQICELTIMKYSTEFDPDSVSIEEASEHE